MNSLMMTILKVDHSHELILEEMFFLEKGKCLAKSFLCI